MTLYFINSDVTFDPESNSLHSIKNNITVSMLTPSGQCLLILLENKGNIVPKKEIYEFVWERYGLTATDNAFYQTVLYLRKNLKEVGLVSEIVKTVPRKGVLVPGSIQVEKIARQQEAQVDSESILLQEDVANEAQVSLNQEPFIAETVLANHIEHNLSDTGAVMQTSKLSIYLLLLLIATLVAIAIPIASGQKNQEATDFFLDYTKVAQLEGCSVFLDASTTSVDEYKNFIATTPINCSKSPYAYFTKKDFVKRISLIACEKEIKKGNKRNECTSYYNIVK